MKNTLVLVSELWHIDHLTKASGTIVGLTLEIEEELSVRGIAHVSARDCRTPDLNFRNAAYAWTKEILEDPEKPFGGYRGVSLGHVYFYPLYLYFTRAAYWIDVIAGLLKKYPKTIHLKVYPSASRATETTGDFAEEEICALVDSALLLGTQKNITVEVPVFPTQQSLILKNGWFAFKRWMFGFVLRLSNLFVRMRQERHLRIVVSDYWRNIKPFLEYLPQAELIFVDRLQALEAGIKNIWKWRIRFCHLDNFSVSETSCLHFTDVELRVQFIGIEVSSLLITARNALIQKYVPSALRDVDRAYAMMERLRPSVITLRVSTAPQRHYSILAQVARELRIPSVEFQHGLEYNGPDSFTIRKSAKYLGVYGSRIKKELVAIGISPERIVVVGSPRFDIYARTQRKHVTETPIEERLSVLCIYPDLAYGDGFDSYDIDNYIKEIATVLSDIPNVRVTVKLRGTRHEVFARNRIAKLLHTIQHDIVRDTPLTTLLQTTQLMITPYSTVVLEAMQAGVPVVFFASMPLERHFAQEQCGPYQTAGALEIAYSSGELHSKLASLVNASVRHSLANRATGFLSEEYAFDGTSAERAAVFLRALARHT